MKIFKYISLVIIIVCNSCLIGCNETNKHASHLPSGEYYTCPMHPTIQMNKPGVCPICNMTLIKVASVNTDTAPNTIHISKHRQELANIKTVKVQSKEIEAERNFLAVVGFSERENSVVTARASGRIENLVVRNPGATIRKGDLLYTLYSEDLISAEKELISALAHKEKYREDDKIINELIEATRKKLLLAGVTNDLLKDLEAKRNVHASIPFYSEVAGTITEISVNEGQYVETGSLIYSIDNISTLWLNTQIYSNEVGVFNNRNATAEINGKIYNVNMDVDAPAIESQSAIRNIKFKLDNKEGFVKPGMMALVKVKEKASTSLVIPKSALVIGKMPMVWLQIGPELFQSKMVRPGKESDTEIEILNGLKAGDVIVTSGAYLINSEYILKKGAAAQHQH